MTIPRRTALLALAGAALLPGAALVPGTAWAASARELSSKGQAALQRLYKVQPRARELGKKAVAILVFPDIVKAGLLIGGQSGNGVLIKGGKSVAYYNISAASFGLQAGAQTFSYALFFMNNGALAYLDKSDGWAVGSGPSLVVADEGWAKSATSTTITQDVYAVPFGQRGLMAGVGIEGSKITRLNPDA